MAYEVYSFQHLTRQLNLNCIDVLLRDGLDAHLKYMRMLKCEVEVRKVFVNKAAAKQNDEVIQCQSKGKLPSLFAYSIEVEQSSLVVF